MTTRERAEQVLIEEGDEAMKRIGEAFADVDPEEIEREAVKAVREVRKEMAAEQRR